MNKKNSTWSLLEKSLSAIGIMFLFISVGVAICMMNKPSPTATRVIQGISVWMAAISFLVFQKVRGKSLKEFGLCSISKERLRNLYYCIPAFALAALSYIEGLGKEGAIYILASLFMAAGVGLEEELYFRGYIFHIWEERGEMVAVVVTSAIFGIMHVANVITGQSLFYTCLHIVFTFSYGLVFNMMYLVGKSLWPCILLHFFHNFSSFICDESNMNLEYGIAAAQTVIMIIYIVMLILKYKKMKQEAE